jgi:hypothetical protein
MRVLPFFLLLLFAQWFALGTGVGAVAFDAAPQQALQSAAQPGDNQQQDDRASLVMAADDDGVDPDTLTEIGPAIPLNAFTLVTGSAVHTPLSDGRPPRGRTDAPPDPPPTSIP